ncbi:hypothetical protein SAMN04488539_0119 [Corynebacterium timonense]|uniref:Uncharacterized protein n=1 Tax=Corynebacterium timonense TaxID=441500 RepID=A0A1H1L9G4_9CORY|nr:hypothetical protein SAMN04488539_0119 [Corynebacterium timonense]
MRSTLVSITTILTLAASSLAPAHAQAAHAQAPNAPSVAQSSATTDQDSAIARAVYYDLREDRFGIFHEAAQSLGYSAEQIRAFERNLAELSPDESRQLATVIGLDVEAIKQQRAIPAVIAAIAGFVGGALGSEIIGQVANWGVATACQNLNGFSGAFDDFCRSNGHI